MRIITGSLKGRKLISPKNNDVRPTTDKVKEAIFDIIYQYIFDGFVAFDLFSGTGNMGLEAISRGASKVFFSDISRESIALTRQNIVNCGVLDKAVLLTGDFKRNVSRVKETIDVYFLDPPYADGYLIPALKAIDESGNISDCGIVVCEHPQRDEMPLKIYGFTRIKYRKYGAIGVSVYMRGDREYCE